jgi:glucan 1,3-beta-glucosidase
MRGLNIGGWLVLEKWMTPELYEGTSAEDEFHLLQARSDYLEMLKHHRDTFITKEDFVWMKSHGIDTVRLPVGHWLFDASEPYVSAKEYVDQAFVWANETKLDIVLDLHAAKGCQNGFDNGGLSGVIGWHKDQQNIDDTLDFLRTLSKTYKNQERLVGIQLLNEPHWTIPLEQLKEFYLSGYRIIREEAGEQVSVIMHDSFRINVWEDFFKQHELFNTYLDTHMYQVFGEVAHDATIFEISEFIKEKRYKKIKELQKYTRVIVGEWSCALPHQTKEKFKSKREKDAAYYWLSNQLLSTFNEADGWFFWNYKLSPVSTKKHIGWSFKDMVIKGYLPFEREE